MDNNFLPLHMAPIGSVSKIKFLTADGNLRRRLLDLGLVNNTLIKSLRKSPSGDPIAYEIRGTVIALRSEEACKVLVEIS